MAHPAIRTQARGSAAPHTTADLRRPRRRAHRDRLHPIAAALQPPAGNDTRTLPGTGHSDPDDTEAHTPAPVRLTQIRSPAVRISRRDLAVVGDVRMVNLSVCGEHVRVVLAG